VTFGERFAQGNASGLLTRAGLAWVLITPIVVIARTLLPGVAAAAVALTAIAVYVVVARRYARQCRVQM
jgi:hypothetical protein